MTDKSGSAVLTVPAEGRYVVSAYDGLLSDSRGVQVVADEQQVFASEIDFDLPTSEIVVTAELSGQLQYDKLSEKRKVLVSGARVQLLEPRTGSILEESTTDKNGRFSFSTRTPGLYALEVSIPNGSYHMTPEAKSKLTAEELDKRELYEDSGIAYLEYEPGNLGQLTGDLSLAVAFTTCGMQYTKAKPITVH